MNYDLFLSPAVSESTYGSSERMPAGRSPRDTAADGEITRVANPGPSVGTTTGQATAETLERTVEALNEVFDQSNVGLQYRVDDATGDLVVSIVDRESGEVLRQLPPEAILKMREKLKELMGVLFDVTA
jgi:flagellar protein FlaG